MSRQRAQRIDRLKREGAQQLAEARFGAAERKFAAAVRLDERDWHALAGLGIAALGQGLAAKAVTAFSRVLVYRPDDAETLTNYATSLLQVGRMQDALVAAGKALALRPSDVRMRMNLANLEIEAGAATAALATLELLPENVLASADGLFLRGTAHLSAGNAGAAAADLAKAFALDGSIEAGRSLVRALKRNDRPREAIAVLDRLDALCGATAASLEERADCHRMANDANSAIEAATRAANLSRDKAFKRAMAIFAASQTLYMESGTNEALEEAHRLAADTMWPSRPPARPATRAKGTLKIGFVSPHFRFHSVTGFLHGPLPLFREFGATIHAYSTCAFADAVTHSIEASVDVFKPTAGRTAESLIVELANDRVDVLVDLGGYMDDMPIEIFARWPAPCQVSWLGYPASLGLRIVDARITDAWADPPATENWEFERLIRLPHFLSYRPLVDARPACVRDVGPIIFGCFNNPAKIGERTAAFWSDILDAVPDSRLLLRGGWYRVEAARMRVLDLLAAHGVQRERIDAGPFELDSNDASFNTYSQVDIALDPVIYNGTTTTCEALWMGVPLVAFPGNRHSARVGVSLLKAAGLDELVATDAADAHTKILALASDRARLARYREGLRSKIEASRLTDHADLARNFVAALRNLVTERN